MVTFMVGFYVAYMAQTLGGCGFWGAFGWGLPIVLALMIVRGGKL